MAPLLCVIGMLRLIDAFKIFDSIFILTSGGPGITTESPSLLAFKMTFEYWKIGEASAFAVLVWITFFIFCNIFYQVAKKRPWCLLNKRCLTIRKTNNVSDRFSIIPTKPAHMDGDDACLCCHHSVSGFLDGNHDVQTRSNNV